MDVVRYPNLSEQLFFDIEVECAGAPDLDLLSRAESALHTVAEVKLEPARWSKLERGLRLARQSSSQ